MYKVRVDIAMNLSCISDSSCAPLRSPRTSEDERDARRGRHGFRQRTGVEEDVAAPRVDGSDDKITVQLLERGGEQIPARQAARGARFRALQDRAAAAWARTAPHRSRLTTPSNTKNPSQVRAFLRSRRIGGTRESSRATAVGEYPAAYSEPASAPLEVPITALTRSPASSMAWMTPECSAKPSHPLDKTRSTLPGPGPGLRLESEGAAVWSTSRRAPSSARK